MSVRGCRCGAVYDETSWTALPLVQRIQASDTSELMTSWPWHGTTEIEARRCACGRDLAALCSLGPKVGSR